MPEDIKEVVTELLQRQAEAARDRLVIGLRLMNTSDTYGEAEVTIHISKGATEADILDALQRGICSAYYAVKREDPRQR